jgi:hypothetical protein
MVNQTNEEEALLRRLAGEFDIWLGSKGFAGECSPNIASSDDSLWFVSHWPIVAI